MLVFGRPRPRNCGSIGIAASVDMGTNYFTSQYGGGRAGWLAQRILDAALMVNLAPLQPA